MNIDVDGANVPSTLTMTGREYDLIRKDEVADDAAVLDALPALVERGTLARPSFVGDEGLFPGSAHRGRIIGPLPKTPAAKCRAFRQACPMLVGAGGSSARSRVN